MVIPYAGGCEERLQKVAGSLDIVWDANTTFKTYFALFHIEDPHQTVPFTEEELQAATAKMNICESVTGDGIVCSPTCTIELVKDPVSNKLLSAGITAEATNVEMELTPLQYYYSVDIRFEDGQVDKVVRGKFKVLPNTVRMGGAATDYPLYDVNIASDSYINVTKEPAIIDSIEKTKVQDFNVSLNTGALDPHITTLITNNTGFKVWDYESDASVPILLSAASSWPLTVKTSRTDPGQIYKWASGLDVADHFPGYTFVGATDAHLFIPGTTEMVQGCAVSVAQPFWKDGDPNKGKVEVSMVRLANSDVNVRVAFKAIYVKDEMLH